MSWLNWKKETGNDEFLDTDELPIEKPDVPENMNDWSEEDYNNWDKYDEEREKYSKNDE